MSFRLTLLVVLVAGLVVPALSPAAEVGRAYVCTDPGQLSGSHQGGCNGPAERIHDAHEIIGFAAGVQAHFSSQAFIDAVDARVAAYCSANDCGSGSGSGSSSEELSPEEIASLWGAAAFLLALAYVFRTLRQTLWR